jgi:hypothetical protein
LPPAGVATAFYFDLPATVDLAAAPSLALKTEAPTRTSVLTFDPDHDGRAGLNLRRTAGSVVAPADQVVFEWGGPAAFRTAGPTSVVAHAAIDSLLPGRIALRGRLLACDATSACTVVAETTSSTLAALVAIPLTLDFGTIDVTVPANGTLRVTVDVPSSSAAGIVLFADTTATPGAITLTMP